MKVVVAGGSGLIGRALVASLAADGVEAVVLSRRPGRMADLPKGVRAVSWDPSAVGEWVASLTGADAIVQLAGEGIASGLWTKERKRRLRESRIVTSRVLAEAVASISPRPTVFVQGSAVGFYGDGGQTVLDEASSVGNGFLAELSEAWEAASSTVEELGVRRVILRTGLVLARDGGLLPVMARPFRLFVGGPIGDGGQWMPWIHLADEVGAIRFLLDHPQAQGPFNVTAPEPATNGAVSRALASALSRPCWLRVPTVAVAMTGEMGRELLLAGQRARPRRLLELGYEFRFPSLEGAMADLYG